jgi:protein-S-isoprenylcysteine O-methyltransferase Ste14
MPSPWWYQRRPTVTAFIYFVGFFAGYYLTSAFFHGTPLPSFVILAQAFHANPKLVLWIATAVGIVGYLLRLWGSSYLTPAIVWSPQARQATLIIDGPFRYVRNPLYLGNVLLAVAIGILAPPIGWVIIVFGNVWFAALLGMHEAAGMRAEYGEAYERYRASVPGLFPRLRPVEREGDAKPVLGAGLRAEAFSLGFVCGMIAFTLSYVAWLFWLFFILGWLAQIVLRLHQQVTSAA